MCTVCVLVHVYYSAPWIKLNGSIRCVNMTMYVHVQLWCTCTVCMVHTFVHVQCTHTETVLQRAETLIWVDERDGTCSHWAARPRQGSYDPEWSPAGCEGHTSSASGWPLRCSYSLVRLRPRRWGGHRHAEPHNDRLCRLPWCGTPTAVHHVQSTHAGQDLDWPLEAWATQPTELK